MPSTLSTILQGVLLGWSVAWPPGPINVEIVRRGTGRGFLPALFVGCGAFSGDFIWALVMSSGASVLAKNEKLKLGLGILSTAFLFFIGVMLVLNGLRRKPGAGASAPADSRRASSNGFLLGFILSITSPWNAGFWFAVAGQSAELGKGFLSSLLLAGSVMLGAAIWVLLLSTSCSLGRGRVSEKWARHSEFAAAALMFYFAAQSLHRLFFLR